MSKNQQPVTRQQLIIERWEQMGKHSAGAAELAMIQEAIVEHFGAVPMMSPAAIARTLADHGVRLSHPEIVEADRLWRERQQLFSPEELMFNAQDAAIALVEKLERGDFEVEQLEQVRQSVRQVKSELELLANQGRSHKDSELAKEYVQWLTVWLQNPQIFAEWAGLRRSTAEFHERFGS